jgi:hypothetical protein
MKNADHYWLDRPEDQVKAENDAIARIILNSQVTMKPSEYEATFGPILAKSREASRLIFAWKAASWGVIVSYAMLIMASLVAWERAGQWDIYRNLSAVIGLLSVFAFLHYVVEPDNAKRVVQVKALLQSQRDEILALGRKA